MVETVSAQRMLRYVSTAQLKQDKKNLNGNEW